jgi:hypothetical protein
MAATGCGCKICKADLGDYTNQLIISGFSPKDVLKTLEERKVKITERLLKKHLSGFQIPYPESDNNEIIECEPIKVDLNKIDFSQYNFDFNNIESIIGYLQKINLKIYLNQTRITLQAQQDVIDGRSLDMPKEIMQNLAVAFQILDKSTGISTHVNQQEAIKVVEAMGLMIQRPTQFYLPNVQNNTNTEAN